MANRRSPLIPTVDLRLLSQPELYSLSLCSNSSCILNRVSIPKINRSAFNESAGSRKQTYSRLRLAPTGSSKTTVHRHTTSKQQVSNDISDPDQVENCEIIRALKKVFGSGPNLEEFVPIEVEIISNIEEHVC